MEKLIEKILAGRNTQHDAAVEVIEHLLAESKHFRRLVNKRDATIKELSKEVHDLETRIAELEGYLDRLLNQCAGDHMTACEKTMGDTHPCTCGATEIRKALQG